MKAAATPEQLARLEYLKRELARVRAEQLALQAVVEEHDRMIDRLELEARRLLGELTLRRAVDQARRE